MHQNESDARQISSIPIEISESFRQLKTAARPLRQMSAEQKNAVLLSLADRLLEMSVEIIKENKKDLDSLSSDTTTAFRDRLLLTPERVQAIAEGLKQVARLGDPVGELVEEQTLPNGLILRKRRAPLGVILMIFESRPNVILEAFSLAFKSGNAIALRGGSDSQHTARMLYKIMCETLVSKGISENVFYGLNHYSRDLVYQLLLRKDWIDVVVPRGGDKLIEFVQKNALMPIIKNDRGLCHTYVDQNASLEMAVKIVTNAKTQRPGVCNSLETVLVHKDIAEDFLPALFSATEKHQVKIRADEASLKILGPQERVQTALEKDWDTEYLDQIMNCKIVDTLDEAIAHIEAHGSRHSEAIITESNSAARHFQNEVDAAAVYWNASTRFTDGFEFGLGGELGISTQKLHVRGPVGLRELTTPRWVIDGTGQIRE